MKTSKKINRAFAIVFGLIGSGSLYAAMFMNAPHQYFITVICVAASIILLTIKD